MARAIVKNQAEISSLNKFGFLGIPGAQGDVPMPTNFIMSHITDTARNLPNNTVIPLATIPW